MGGDREKRHRASPSPTRGEERQVRIRTNDVIDTREPVRGLAREPVHESAREPVHESARERGLASLAQMEMHPLLAGHTAPLGDLSARTGALALRSSSAASLTKTDGAKTTSPRDNPFLAHRQQGARDTRRVPFFDRRLATRDATEITHRPRPLRFHAPGTHIAQAEAERLAAQMRQLEREIAETSATAGVDVELVADVLRAEKTRPALGLEWWDVPFVGPFATREELQTRIATDALAYELLGNLIQRPSLKTTDAGTTRNETTVTPQVYLTRDERRKLRRQRRLEEQRELQEKVALGLLPPPPPKMKLSSLPRMLMQPGNTLANESVQEPTRIDAEIRQQSAARAAAHVAALQEHKLTDAERAAKRYRKYAELDADACHVAVFLLRDRLEDGRRRFRVLANAEQNHLHGRAVVTRDFALVVVEGGPRGVARYKRLLLERMAVADPDAARLLWEGVQPARSPALAAAPGRPFQLLTPPSDFDARETLEALGWGHFWTLAHSTVSGQ